MTQIIFNADDFGYSKGVNLGIIEAHQNGVITSTTLLVNGAGAEHAASLIADNPELGVGLEFNIAFRKPLTNGKSLVDKKGNLIKPQFLPENFKYDEDELWDELKAQYQRFIDLTGRKPTHLDSHLFTSDRLEQMHRLTLKLAEEVRLPIRNIPTDSCKTVQFVQYRTFNAKPNLDYIVDYIDEIIKFDVVDIMTHPAYADQYLLAYSSWYFSISFI